MSKLRRSPVTFVVVIGCSLLAAATALLGVGLAAGPFAGLAAVAAAVGLVAQLQAEPTAPPEVVARAVGQVDSGRRLAIYERETGLLAHWYIALRGQEECDRAHRYQHPLSVLVLEPATAEEAWDVKDRLSRLCATELRATDLAAYLGNGRHLVLMPETDADATRKALGRLLEAMPEVLVGLSVYAEDALTFEDLYRIASDRLLGEVRPAAAA